MLVVSVVGTAVTVKEPSSAAVGCTLWLMRHGETEWSRAGRFTGRTDIPLTQRGQEQARRAGERCAEQVFDVVLVSPLVRARLTAELAGFREAECEPLAQEWDYGAYEGALSSHVRQQHPEFTVWDHPIRGAESLEQVAGRAERVIARVGRELELRSRAGASGSGQALIVAHGHFLRVLACRWLGVSPRMGKHLLLGTAQLAMLGWDKGNPVIIRWGL